MSNKKTDLLKESTIRRFMKLANMDTLSESFLDGLKEKLEDTEVTEAAHEEDEKKKDKMDEEDDAQNEGMYGAEDDDDEKKDEGAHNEGYMMGAEDDEMGAEDDDMPPMDMDPEPEMGAEPAMGDEKEELARKVAVAVAGELEKVLGVEMSVEGGEDDAPMGDAPMDDAPMDMDPPDDEEDMGMPEAQEQTEDTLEESGISIIDDDALVEEITKRVAKRLLDASKKK